ncbi:MAG: DNA polymerase III subunit gamma/tau [Fidelibacterota bacterium]|nr:MAG: DNA polymerase III subunit gamma/tau [Candidatus Neomarinimicrobiota bacterium]
MSYQVLSRKWRPQVFEELIGQSHVVQTLQNALKRGRVAHAYMLTGPRGVGKTTTARILSKTLNCPNSDGINPCNDCPICMEITRGNNLDVLEIDGASNRGIDEIRELREAVKYPPTSGKYRIYIIDEVHMLTLQAFNALLKTLEEPPSSIVFILATTDPQKVPQTILSRTQRFDFKRIPTTEIAALLARILDEEQISYEKGALTILARKADGSIRDGLSLLDQIIAYHSDKVDEASVLAVLGLVEDTFYAQLLDSISRHDHKQVLAKVEAIFDGGYEIKEVCQGFNQFLRDGILTLETSDPSLTSRGALVDIPEGLTTGDLVNLLNIGLATEGQLRYAQQPRLLMEHQLLKMAELDRVVSIKEVLQGLATAVGNTPHSGSGSEADRGLDSESRPPAPRAEHLPKVGTRQETSSASPVRRTFTRNRPEVQDEGSIPDSSDSSIGDKPQHLIPSDAMEQLRERWEDIISDVAKQSQGAATTLSGSEAADLDGKNLTIHLPASQSIHLKILMDKRDLVENAIQNLMGWKLRILPTIPETQAHEPHSKDAPSKGSALIEELTETFKGEEY